MVSTRTTAVAVAAVTVAAAILAAFAFQQGCGASAALPAPVPEPVRADVHVAQSGLAGDGSGGRPFRGRQDVAFADAGSELAAVRDVALYCHLVEAGQFARAGSLCARRRLWSRQALAGVTRFHFRSARVFAAPDARTLVLKARVHVHAGRGRPLPGGLAVIFFTLGRAGSAAGGWLITTVSTSP